MNKNFASPGARIFLWVMGLTLLVLTSISFILQTWDLGGYTSLEAIPNYLFAIGLIVASRGVET